MRCLIVVGGAHGAAGAAKESRGPFSPRHGLELRKVGIRYRHDQQGQRSEEHTSELQSPCNLVCRLLLEKKKNSVAQLLLDDRSMRAAVLIRLATEAALR